MMEYYTLEEKEGTKIFKKVEPEKMRIKGYSVEEIIEILDALSIERIYDIKMTMNNLKELIKIQQEEQDKIFREQLEKMDYTKDEVWATIPINRVLFKTEGE